MSQQELIAETLQAARTLILSQAGYTCIHDRPAGHFRYCDSCPLSHIGQESPAFTYQQSRIICTDRRSYSK